MFFYFFPLILWILFVIRKGEEKWFDRGKKSKAKKPWKLIIIHPLLLIIIIIIICQLVVHKLNEGLDCTRAWYRQWLWSKIWPPCSSFSAIPLSFVLLDACMYMIFVRCIHTLEPYVSLLSAFELNQDVACMQVETFFQLLMSHTN